MNEITPDAEMTDGAREDRPGAMLRRAREERGMSIGEVAEMTRIAQRQLEAVERDDFRALPGTPYAVGFARAYARAVGADEVAVAKGVRQQLGMLGAADRYEAFEPVDPARIPPRRLAWVAAIVMLVLAVAYGVWRTQFFTASTDEEISDISNRTGQVAAPAVNPTVNNPAAPASGPVVLTATGEVWLRIYDQAGERLFERQMAKGESYTVPPEANNPMILTGRPDAIAVTVGGKPVAPLGPPERTISDVPISAAALLARPSGEGPGDRAGVPAATAPVRPGASAAIIPATRPSSAGFSQPAQAAVATPMPQAATEVASD
ncbi:MAG: helix-turn-helix domain-containing protein [Sphingobium sp.]